MFDSAKNQPYPNVAFQFHAAKETAHISHHKANMQLFYLCHAF